MKFILTSSLVSALILAVSISSLVSSFNSATLNGSLAESGLYEKLPRILVEQLFKASGGTDPKALEAAYSKVKDDPTFGYLRNIIEKFNNDLFEYLDGKINALPAVSLPDKVPAGSLWGALIQPMLKGFGISKTLELPADITSNIEAVKQGYKWFKLSPLLLAALALLFALILILFGKDWAHRAKLLGKAFLSASILGLVLFGVLMVLLPQLPGLQIPNIPPALQFAQEPILALFATFLSDINFNQGVLYGIIFAVGLILFIGSRFLPKKESGL